MDIIDCCNDVNYNQFGGLDEIGYKVIQYLMLNNENIWKLLKYPTPDALLKDNLSMREKAALIYDGADDTSDYRVFRSAYMDDIFDDRCSQLRVYITSINPDNHIYSTVDIGIELVVHNKIINLVGYKNRLEVMLKECLKTLNGAYVGGIGKLMFDRNMSFYDLVKLNLYNNRNFYGYTLIMSTKLGTVDTCDTE